MWVQGAQIIVQTVAESTLSPANVLFHSCWNTNGIASSALHREKNMPPSAEKLAPQTRVSGLRLPREHRANIFPDWENHLISLPRSLTPDMFQSKKQPQVLYSQSLKFLLCHAHFLLVSATCLIVSLSQCGTVQGGFITLSPGIWLQAIKTEWKVLRPAWYGVCPRDQIPV